MILPPERFVFCVQNHNQVGNRPGAERLSALAGLEAQKAAAALLLAAPQTPMLFMGEEWGERRGFHYFTDHQDPGLARAVSHGRRHGLREHGHEGEPLDPQSPRALAASRLDWSLPRRRPHAGVLALYRRLLALRRRRPELASGRLDRVLHDGRILAYERRGSGGRAIAVIANLSAKPAAAPAFAGRWRRLLSTRERRFGGPGGPFGGPSGELPGRCAVIPERA